MKYGRLKTGRVPSYPTSVRHPCLILWHDNVLILCLVRTSPYSLLRSGRLTRRFDKRKNQFEFVIQEKFIHSVLSSTKIYLFTLPLWFTIIVHYNKRDAGNHWLDYFHAAENRGQVTLNRKHEIILFFLVVACQACSVASFLSQVH